MRVGEQQVGSHRLTLTAGALAMRYQAWSV